MSKNSSIEWTDHTFNPWWGCTKISPGCKFCYAAAFAKRLAKDCWGDNAPRIPASPNAWAEVSKWNRQAELRGQPAKVFCGSMCDVFEPHASRAVVEAHYRLFETIQQTPWLTWQLLTKRPEHIADIVPGGYSEPLTLTDAANWLTFPRPNVWLGTSVEDQEHAEKRLPALLAIPAVVRFVSVEPMLGPVSLKKWVGCRACWGINRHDGLGDPCKCCWGTGRAIHWVIIGGESGRGARPCSLRWIVDLVDECRRAGVPVFIKQLGAMAIAEDTIKVGATPSPWLWVMADSKGGNPKEWPMHFPRDRAFPSPSCSPHALSKCP